MLEVISLTARGNDRMQYDFDAVIDRTNTNSSKWDKNLELFGRDDVLDMWVADMDFPSPQPVIDAMRERLEHPFFGYTFPSDSLYEAVIERMERYYGWEVPREWIVFTPGVVNSLYASLKALANPGDQVVIQSPVYFPFFGAVQNNGCQVVNNQLRFDGEQYTMDLDQLADCFVTSSRFPARSHRIRALVLCSPHNPVGRVWTPDELSQLGELCLENNCVLISDEIHCDLLVGDVKHTVTSTVSPEVQQNTITLMSPSKTFNLAGMGASFAIIPNPEWRAAFSQARVGQAGVNVMGLVAMEAALRHGDDYLKQLNAYLRNNIDYFARRLEAIPGLKMLRPEGTYLVWVDMRALGMDDEQLRDFMLERARIATDFGFVFGPGGEGFQRFNLACPRSIVVEAVDRLEGAVGELTS